MSDRYAVACNYAEGTHTSSEGALAYLADSHWGGGGFERVQVVARSRGGRWITIWSPIARLTNFRAKTLPLRHPLYAHERIGWHDSKEAAATTAASFQSMSLAWIRTN